MTNNPQTVSVQILHHVHDNHITASDITGARSDLERCSTLAKLLPGPSRRFIKTKVRDWAVLDGYPRGVTSANLKSGLVRVSFHWYSWQPEYRVPDCDIIAACLRLRSEILAQPGRPENWPFPTWSGGSSLSAQPTHHQTPIKSAAMPKASE